MGGVCPFSLSCSAPLPQPRGGRKQPWVQTPTSLPVGWPCAHCCSWPSIPQSQHGQLGRTTGPSPVQNHPDQEPRPHFLCQWSSKCLAQLSVQLPVTSHQLMWPKCTTKGWEAKSIVANEAHIPCSFSGRVVLTGCRAVPGTYEVPADLL